MSRNFLLILLYLFQLVWTTRILANPIQIPYVDFGLDQLDTGEAAKKQEIVGRIIDLIKRYHTFAIRDTNQRLDKLKQV